MAKPTRPRDPMQLAKLIGDMATGEVPNDSPKCESETTASKRKAGQGQAGGDPHHSQRAASMRRGCHGWAGWGSMHGWITPSPPCDFGYAPGMTPEDVIATARRLRIATAAIRVWTRGTRAMIAAQHRRSPFLRVHRLARGANDDAIETRARRCPHCESERIKPLGRVRAERGMLKIAHACEGCEKPFVFVRRARDFSPGPAEPPDA